MFEQRNSPLSSRDFNEHWYPERCIQNNGHLHDRTIYLIRDLRGGSNPGVPPSPHAPPPPVSQRRHAPCTVAGRGGRVAKRTAEQSVGEAKVAKAKQRILAGQYGRSTPKNNRVKEAVIDLSLSGKQAQRLREELRDVATPSSDLTIPVCSDLALSYVPSLPVTRWTMRNIYDEHT